MRHCQNRVNSETINEKEAIVQTSTQLKEWLNPSELAKEYGFSRSTQAKMRMSSNKSNLPFSKVGSFIRYRRTAINIWLQNHQVQGEV